MPVAPKDPRLRQRRNRASTRATLPSPSSVEHNEVPPLPKREKSTETWHARVVEWWTAVWTSPMATEYLGPDKLGGLYLLAELHQQRWTTEDPTILVKLASEIRQQEVRFGLSPIDRRRLQWEVEKGEQAKERTEHRRNRKATDGKDPRDLLRAVK